jgi:hypothetical protein
MEMVVGMKETGIGEEEEAGTNLDGNTLFTVA